MLTTSSLPALRRSLALAAASALAIGTVLVGGAFTDPADAARTKTWERLANCESGKRWHINTGNGYYGGLQFSRGTWLGYDGGHFARRADKASKRQQIAVAERVLDRQGWGAWPSCSDRLNLTRKQARAKWGIGKWRHKDGIHRGSGKHLPGGRFGVQQ